MSNYDDRSGEIDEFAMFQARSMGVETEYLEMAKAGRLGGRSPRCQRPREGNSPPATTTTTTAAAGSNSSVVPRTRKPRSADGRHRSIRFEEGHSGRQETTPTPSPKHCDLGAVLDGGGDVPGPNRAGAEDYDDRPRRLERIADGGGGGEEAEVEESDESQSLNRSHSFRAKRIENEKNYWMDRANLPDEGTADGGLEVAVVKTDLKRTLTMPAKRHRSTGGRESVRSWNRPPPPDAAAAAGPEATPPQSSSSSRAAGDLIPWSGHHSCDGPQRSNKTGGSGSWKDGGGGGHGGPTAGKKACLIRHDSSGSSSGHRTHHTPDRTSNNDGHSSSRADEANRGGGGRGVVVVASRVERPGNEVTVYKVLVLGSQGVGKSTVTQQLLSVGDDVNDDDDSSDRIVCVQVDEEESYLEFIDDVSCQGNRSKQGVDANLVVYSVTDRSSFAFAQSCLQELRPAKRHNVVILVANKQDLVRNRIISEDDGKSLAAKRHCKFIEVSALLSLKMEDLLVGIARQIRLRKGRASSAPSTCDRGDETAAAAAADGAFDTGLGCLQRAALRAIRKVFRRRPVESTSCDNLCTP